MKKILVLFIMLSTGLSQGFIKSTTNNESYNWSFIENYFIAKPALQNNSFKNRLKRWTTTGASALTAFLASKAFLNYAINSEERDGQGTENVKNSINIASSVGSALTAHYLIRLHQQENLEHTNLLTFIQGWPTRYRHLTPDALKSYFDILYKEYLENPTLIKEQSSKNIEYIKDIIHAQFPQKYQAYLQTPSSLPDFMMKFFTHKSFEAKAHFDCAVGKVLEGTAKVIQAVKN